MYCHIIGYPLNKPRSVKIWKNFFKKNHITCKMTAKEIDPKKLSNCLKKFKSDNEFLATAVTMPLKDKVSEYISYGNSISKHAKSINLILKKNNSLIGYNTDVVGALEDCKKNKKKNIMIFGMGGTGKSILRVFQNKFKKTDFHIISSKRHPEFKKIKNINLNKDIKSKDLKNIDLFINCSPLGSCLSEIYKNKTPLLKYQIQLLKKSCVIFDIVYAPKLTILGKLSKESGIKFINGIKMNTIQANYALKKIQKVLPKNLLNIKV